MSDLTPHSDPEMNEFEQALLRSIEQAKRGEYAAVHTPETIAARRAGGRPKLSTHKKPVTLRMTPEALARWRASGKGWQTRAAAVLAEHAPKG